MVSEAIKRLMKFHNFASVDVLSHIALPGVLLYFKENIPSIILRTTMSNLILEKNKTAFCLPLNTLGKTQ